MVIKILLRIIKDSIIQYNNDKNTAFKVLRYNRKYLPHYESSIHSARYYLEFLSSIIRLLIPSKEIADGYYWRLVKALFIQFLAEKKLIEEFTYELAHYHYTHSYTTIDEYFAALPTMNDGSIPQPLSYGFSWSHTRKGYSYWHKICIEWGDYLETKLYKP